MQDPRKQKIAAIVMFVALFAWFSYAALSLMSILSKETAGRHNQNTRPSTHSLENSIAGLSPKAKSYTKGKTQLPPPHNTDIEFPDFIVRTALTRPVQTPGYIVKEQLINEPVQIRNITYDDILNSLGKPDLTRGEGHTKMLQYASTQCVLDLYFSFSPDQNNQVSHGHASRIAYYEMRSKQEAPLHRTFNLTPNNSTSIYKACMGSIFRDQKHKNQSAQRPSKQHTG